MERSEIRDRHHSWAAYPVMNVGGAGTPARAPVRGAKRAYSNCRARDGDATGWAADRTWCPRFSRWDRKISFHKIGQPAASKMEVPPRRDEREGRESLPAPPARSWLARVLLQGRCFAERTEPRVVGIVDHPPKRSKPNPRVLCRPSVRLLVRKSAKRTDILFEDVDGAHARSLRFEKRHDGMIGQRASASHFTGAHVHALATWVGLRMLRIPE